MTRRSKRRTKATIDPVFDEFVAKLVRSGRYRSPSDVVHDALQLLMDREDLRELRIEQLKEELQIGIDQWERGDYDTWDVEQIKAEGRRQLALRKRRKAG